MYSHEYSKELALKTTDKKVPLVYVIVVFAVFIAACWFGYTQIQDRLPADRSQVAGH